MVFSMSRKENCWDSAPTERFFSSLTRECLTGNIYPTREYAITCENLYCLLQLTQDTYNTGGRTPPSNLRNEFKQVSG
ncbi:hypothetical protein GL2_08460 [Microbulbifer sp. GL-2]|nr:hypothetical protein GL2_08460 [Microbulbifer sp. GL-2]